MPSSWFAAFPGENTLPDLGIAALSIFLVGTGFWLIHASRPEAISQGGAWVLLMWLTTILLCGLSTTKQLFHAGWMFLRTGELGTAGYGEEARARTVDIRLMSTVAFGLVLWFLIKITHTPECLSGGGQQHEAWRVKGRSLIDHVFCYPVAVIDHEDISIKAHNGSQS